MASPAADDDEDGSTEEGVAFVALNFGKVKAEPETTTVLKRRECESFMVSNIAGLRWVLTNGTK